MPYIKKERRDKYTKYIDELTKLFINNGKDVPLLGEVNYVFSRIIWNIFDNNKSYISGNNLMGVVECIKQEFYRRKLSKLEDEKIKSNGDI